MTPSKILVETAAPVTTIVINRPQAKNALDNEAAHAELHTGIQPVHSART